MSILLTRESRVLVQGLTGREGSFHTEQMKAYGTNVVAGVSPGKGGTTHLGIPVFDTVADARHETGADVSGIFVPAPFAADAIMEAAAAGIGLIVCITEGIPLYDMVRARAFVIDAGAKLIGPNCPGLATAGWWRPMESSRLTRMPCFATRTCMGPMNRKRIRWKRRPSGGSSPTSGWMVRLASSATAPGW